jgi:ABC-type spermidine/putrescine transport system permease subunit II
MLFPLITPEIVMDVALFLVFTNLFRFVDLGTPAQLLGHVTFTISYVVVVLRGRLFAVTAQYEEAATDLGASRGRPCGWCCCRCSCPRSTPASRWSSRSRSTTS